MSARGDYLCCKALAEKKNCWGKYVVKNHQITPIAHQHPSPTRWTFLDFKICHIKSTHLPPASQSSDLVIENFAKTAVHKKASCCSVIVINISMHPNIVLCYVVMVMNWFLIERSEIWESKSATGTVPCLFTKTKTIAFSRFKFVLNLLNSINLCGMCVE